VDRNFGPARRTPERKSWPSVAIICERRASFGMIFASLFRVPVGTDFARLGELFPAASGADSVLLVSV
jgi:hypothetical protein